MLSSYPSRAETFNGGWGVILPPSTSKSSAFPASREETTETLLPRRLYPARFGGYYSACWGLLGGLTNRSPVSVVCNLLTPLE